MLKAQHFAIPIESLQEMVVLPAVYHVPNTPEYIRGVINLRGRVFPLVDLRKRIGWLSSQEDVSAFCHLMEQREQDHKNWLGALESSVRDGVQFKLTTDPHQCAFGKWYDSYHADNPWLTDLLKAFDDPHQAIHREGATICRLVVEGKRQEAEKHLQETQKSVLSVLLRLFAELRALFRQSHIETVAILRAGERTFGVTVDAAISVEKLAPHSIEDLPANSVGNHHNIVQRLGARATTKEIVLIIEPKSILSDFTSSIAFSANR